MTSHILRIAVPSPLHRLFDYLPPREPHPAPRMGQRVRVPFGKGECVGVVVELAQESELPLERLRPVLAILDEEPLLPEELMRLLAWSSNYYHHPPGEVYATALPKRRAAADRRTEDRKTRPRAVASSSLRDGADLERGLSTRDPSGS